ncbi:MAG TPA: hypothetical protein VL242_44850 [Sorangium sp.]|nr:hypothetical protein [Sorangium sp.]
MRPSPRAHLAIAHLAIAHLAIARSSGAPRISSKIDCGQRAAPAVLSGRARSKSLE